MHEMRGREREGEEEEEARNKDRGHVKKTFYT